MALGQRDVNTIRSLSRTHVKTTLAGLKRFTEHSRWLGKNNRYSVDTIAKIRSEISGTGIENPRHLSHYIAASSLLHCADGWSYLGSSILSLLRGDPHRTRHLAYYAELRAAMSLLAAAGIGVFERKHFVVSAPHTVVPLNGGGGTHPFTRDCLVAWASTAASGDVFSKVVKPYGRSLNDWLAPLGGGSAVAPQAQDWFRQWGMDLMVLEQDYNARNVSSYRPEGIPSGRSIDPSTTIKFVKDFWKTLEPSSASSFDSIDRHILRLSLESIFSNQFGIKIVDDPGRFKNFIRPIVKHQGLSPEIEKNWIRFITRKQDRNDPRIFTLSEQSPTALGDSALAIVSRATLLLRMASGSNSDLFQDAGYNMDLVAFWWQSIGQERGLWDGTRDADTLTDLWSDIAVCLDDIENFQSTYRPNKQTFSKFGTEYGKTFPSLGSCELPLIWSMASA